MEMSDNNAACLFCEAQYRKGEELSLKDTIYTGTHKNEHGV